MLLEELAVHDDDGEKEEVGKAVPQAPSKSLFSRTPLQQHKVNTRSGMRLRRLRRSDEGPKKHEITKTSKVWRVKHEIKEIKTIRWRNGY